MRPSRFTWPFHSDSTEYYTKSNNILEEGKFLHHRTPTSVSYLQIKSLYLNDFIQNCSARFDSTSGSHELWVIIYAKNNATEINYDILFK